MNLVSLGELMPDRIPSVDPSRSLDETFELWSIPAFDVGRPRFLTVPKSAHQRSVSNQAMYCFPELFPIFVDHGSSSPINKVSVRSHLANGLHSEANEYIHHTCAMS